MFVLSSYITIGDFQFSGVNDVYITRSIHSIADTAILKLPSVARIVSNGKVMPETVITGKQFNDGDPVIIKLGYNSDLQTEFQGFVKRRNLDMPLEVECEGYSWLLRRNSVTQFYSSVTVKELLETAVAGIDADYTIEVQCEVDFELNNVRISDESGFDVINNISKMTDGCLSCFFIQPTVLWCGFLYTPYAQGNDVLDSGTVNYRLGYNVVKDNSLQERIIENDPVEVKYSKKLSNGHKITAVSDAFPDFSATRSKILNHISDQSGLNQLANEKAYQLNYSGYEGSINAFLQPYATPGYVAYISDDRYPERDADYLIESTEVHFGIKGARRVLEIGPKIGFVNEPGND